MGVCEKGDSSRGQNSDSEPEAKTFYDRPLQIKGNERFLVILGSLLAGFYYAV